MHNESPISFDILSLKITPTHYEGFDIIPCSVRMFDGSACDRVSIIKKEDFDFYWGLADESSMLNLNDVEEIYESSFRVPCEFASIMAMAPEMGMGYRRFWISFSGDRRILVTAGNLNDFFDFPEGCDVSDIIGVEVISGYVKIRTQAESSPIKWLVI